MVRRGAVAAAAGAVPVVRVAPRIAPSRAFGAASRLGSGHVGRPNSSSTGHPTRVGIRRQSERERLAGHARWDVPRWRRGLWCRCRPAARGCLIWTFASGSGNTGSAMLVRGSVGGLGCANAWAERLQLAVLIACGHACLHTFALVVRTGRRRGRRLSSPAERNSAEQLVRIQTRQPTPRVSVLSVASI